MSEIAISALLVAAGLAALYYGARWLVGGSVGIARRLRISELVIGLTIVAYGTSTPELAVSIAATLEDHADIVLANVVGSNIINIGLITGLSAAMLPILVSKTTIRREVPIMILTAFLLVVLSMDGSISRLEGVALIAGFLAFTYFIYTKSRREEDHPAYQQPPSRLEQKQIGRSRRYLLRSFLLVAIGGSLVFGGSSLTVDNAVVIARSIGISERIIGLTIIAIGTSLPELAASVVALRRGHAEMSIGNILGSNIYNILLIVGVSSTLAGLAVNPAIFTDYLVMIAFSLVLVPIMRTNFVISRLQGYMLTAGYATYLTMLFLLR
ncbi:MAG: calcium/sodium antiporter [Nitrososphaerales archaeon]